VSGEDPALARLAQAGSLPVLLDAAYEAFSRALAVIRAAEDNAGGLLPALVMAAAAAADGRDAIATAPALPPARGRALPAMPRAAPADAAGRVARLAWALQARLASVAGGTAADQAACRAAAGCAATIGELLAAAGG